ncbi:hypothetical protein N9934_05550 [Desulfosarcina sp.]|nr:hypothetical protein [Desulfosarcina sp.]
MKMAISVIYTFWRCFFQTFQAVVTFIRRKMSRLKSKTRSNSVVSDQQALYMDIKSSFLTKLCQYVYFVALKSIMVLFMKKEQNGSPAEDNLPWGFLSRNLQR